MESPVLPPVLVPRFSHPMPSNPQPLMPFQRIPEPQMPQNIYYNTNGFSAPPINHVGAGVGPGNPMSPGMSSGGIPSPGPVMSPSVSRNRKFLFLVTQKCCHLNYEWGVTKREFVGFSRHFQMGGKIQENWQILKTHWSKCPHLCCCPLLCSVIAVTGMTEGG